jgi:HlyD family secretion protein
MNLKIAKLSLASAKLNLEKAVIVAPFDGVVTDVTITEGKEITTALLASPAISLVDTSEIEMRGFIDEIDTAMVQLGQEANILLDALPDEEVNGRVTFISPIGTIRAGVVSYETTITLENPVAGLRDGMSATAEVVIERRDDVLLIPNRAIRGTWENPTVVVLVDEQEEEREITLGLSDGINTEVLLGLEEGEKVVLPAVEEQSDGFFPM